MRTLKLGTVGVGVFTLAMNLACAGLVSSEDEGDISIESLTEAVEEAAADAAEAAEEVKGDGTNGAACRAYIEAYNAASCIPVDLNADTTCGNLDMAGAPDMTAFYNCMAGITCDGPIPKIPDCTAFTP